MKQKFSYTAKTVLAVVTLLILTSGVSAFSQEPSLNTSNTAGSGETASSDTAVQEKITRWKELREKDPQAFKQKMQERKGQIKDRMQKLQQENPQKFEQFKERFVERRQERMKTLRQENPEKFKQVMAKREQRLETWKEKNPEKYNQFLQNHPKVQERMQNREAQRNERRESHQGQTDAKGQERRQAFAKEHSGEASPSRENRFMGGSAHKGEASGDRRMENNQRQQAYKEPRENFRNGNHSDSLQSGGGGRQNFPGRKFGPSGAGNQGKGNSFQRNNPEPQGFRAQRNGNAGPGPQNSGSGPRQGQGQKRNAPQR